MENQQKEELLEQLARSLVVGQEISDLLDTFGNSDVVKCVIAASIDAWVKSNGEDAIAIVEDMLEMMKTVHDEKGE